MISSLLHLVGVRPRVYYTLTNFRGGGGKAPLAPLNTPMMYDVILSDRRGDLCHSEYFCAGRLGTLSYNSKKRVFLFYYYF